MLSYPKNMLTSGITAVTLSIHRMMRPRKLGPLTFSLASCAGFILMVLLVVIAIPQSIARVQTTNNRLRPSDLLLWYYRLELFVAWFGIVELHQILHARGGNKDLRLRFWGVRIGDRLEGQNHSWPSLLVPALLPLLLILVGGASYATGLIGTYLLWPLLIMMIVDLARWASRYPAIRTAVASARSSSSLLQKEGPPGKAAPPTHAPKTSKHRPQQGRVKKKRKRR